MSEWAFVFFKRICFVITNYFGNLEKIFVFYKKNCYFLKAPLKLVLGGLCGGIWLLSNLGGLCGWFKKELCFWKGG